MVGAVRHFRLADGGELREQLLSLSDEKRTLSYCLLEAPLPLMGYVATVRLKPVTDGNAHILGMALGVPPAGAPARGTGRAGRRRHLSGRLRGHAQSSASRTVRHADRRRELPGRLPLPHVRRRACAGVTVVERSSGHGLQRPAAIVVERYGGPEVLQFRRSTAAPAPGEVRIRHSGDRRQLHRRLLPHRLFRPAEAARRAGHGGGRRHRGGRVGRVAARAGDRVAYACPPVGAYSERRNMSPELLVRLPDDISDEIAAAGLLKGVTASFLLHDVHPVRAGQSCSSTPPRAASASCSCNGRAISARPSSLPYRATTRRGSPNGLARITSSSTRERISPMR